jgi:glycosyltransferase involved in cell wall biosynthesis
VDRPHDVPFLVEQVNRLRRAGMQVDVFSFRGRANPLRYAAAWRRLRAGHDLSGFDLVHAHFGQSGLVALPCPAPLVVTFHGSDLQGVPGADGRLTLSGWILRAMSRFVARRATKAIVVSAHMQSILPAAVEAEVIPCGIDLQAFTPLAMAEARAELGLSPDSRLVLFVGDPANLIKRHALAVAAVARIDPKLDARLVTLHGEPHSMVPVYMSACDALLVTSNHEGSPTAVKEALACGLPVVSVPVGDVTERLRGVPECRVCESDDLNEISTCLEELVRSPVRSAAGRNAVADLDHSVITTKLVNLYQDVVRLATA